LQTWLESCSAVGRGLARWFIRFKEVAKISRRSTAQTLKTRKPFADAVPFSGACGVAALLMNFTELDLRVARLKNSVLNTTALIPTACHDY